MLEKVCLGGHLTTENYQILSLDGGGIKGIFSAAVLANLEEDLNIRIQDHFDLIAGTSTGGIIALGLGLGMSPREILDFYIQEGGQIFPEVRFSGVQHFFKRKFPREPLEKALKGCFGDKKLGHSSKRLIIPSYSLSNQDVFYFRTSHCDHLKRDYKLDVVKIALATSAAPTYFPVYDDLDGNRLVDGGVLANNPIMVAVTEAIGFLKWDISKLKAFSIGTTAEVKDRSKKLDEGGLLAWAETAPDLIMEAQSISATKQAENILGPESVLRLNPKVCDGTFSLDKAASARDLMGKASHESRLIVSKFEDNFKGHKASPFTPCHKLEK